MHALQGLTLLLFYALPDARSGINPNWEAIGYPGPRSAPPDTPKTISVTRPPDAGLVIEADVVVVGSGAGGGVIAGELAGQGKQVCVLEMGGYYNEADFNQLEMWAYEHLFRGGGITQTDDGSIVLMAGANLGGGTTVNWTNCLRTKPWVREQWEREFGLEGLAGTDYDRHLDAVSERINVNPNCSDWNGPHLRIKEGCEKLGYDFEVITRNADPSAYDPESAGYLSFGDQSGAKLGTLKTYLQDAADAGAQFVVNCRVDRVLVENGRAAGVEGTYTDEDGRSRSGHRARAARSSWPADRSSRRPCSCARASAGRHAGTTCAYTRPRPWSASTTSRRRAGGGRPRAVCRTTSTTSRTATGS